MGSSAQPWSDTWAMAVFDVVRKPAQLVGRKNPHAKDSWVKKHRINTVGGKSVPLKSAHARLEAIEPPHVQIITSRSRLTSRHDIRQVSDLNYQSGENDPDPQAWNFAGAC
jgi:hypothetical protein